MKMMKTMKTTKLFCAAGLLFVLLLGGVETAAAQAPEIDSPSSRGPDNGRYTVTFDFTKAINFSTFTEDDITVTGPGSVVSGSLVTNANQLEATISIKPISNRVGYVTVRVPIGAFADADGNTNTRAAEAVFFVDSVPPTGKITGTPTTATKDAFDVTINFSEPVKRSTQSSITLDPATAGTLALTPGDISFNQVYTLTITPADDVQTDVKIKVPAGAVKDDEGKNPNAAFESSTFRIDTRPPTVSSITGIPPTATKDPFEITITFSEDVTGFEATDIGLSDTNLARVGNFNAGSGTTYTATITPQSSQDGTLTISIAAGAAVDAAQNGNTAFQSQTATIDTVPPTVSSITGLPTTATKDPFEITITFSEDVTGFEAGDITFSNTNLATVGTVSGSGTTYTATITPQSSQDGTLTISIAAGAAVDAAQNGNTAFQSETATIDTAPPTVTVAGPSLINVPTDFTVTFSENVNGFTASDFGFSGSATPALTSGTDGTNEYKVTLTPDADVQETERVITIAANAVTDRAGNGNSLYRLTGRTVDTVSPTVTFEDVPDAVQLEAFDITVVFSEGVSGFDKTDIDDTQSPVAFEVEEVVPESNSRYTLTVTPDENAEGTVIIGVKAGAATNSGNNLNLASDLLEVSVKPGWIPDDNLRAVVRETLGLREGQAFVRSDLEAISVFTASYRQITDLTGLEHAIYLTVIALDGNSIEDLTPLKTLEELTTLDLSNNSISDILPLEELIYLTELNLATNQIEDIIPLALLQALTTLNLRENSISDLAVLSELTALEHLYLTTNQIEDASPLAALPNLKTLRISGNPLTDAEALVGLAETVETDAEIPNLVADDALRAAIEAQLDLPAAAELTRAVMQKLTTLEADLRSINNLSGLEHAENLTVLNLEGNAIKELTPIAGLLKLTFLDLSGNAVSDLAPLEGLTVLETLDLRGNAISNLTPIAGLTTLKTLDLSGNAIHDIDALSDLDALITLHLNKNPIEDLAPLARLTGLQTLVLRTCAVKDVAAISGLTALLELDLSDNAITDITGLEDLTELTTLKLNTNRIESLEGLASMAYLTVLDIARNAVKDISSLANVRSLIALDASNNAITEVSALSQLSDLTVLRLSQNSISVVDPIMGLKELKVLEAHSNSIDDVSKLDTLTALERLDLRRNNISEIRALAELSELSVLGLAENPILDTSPLYPLTRRNPPVYIDISVERYAPWDVNEDGRVNTADLESVTKALGQTDKDILDRRTDVNADGSVDASDLALVQANVDASAAPAMNRRVEISVMQRETRRPEKTALLANYPNPFNPETWIPYTLAVGADVEISIYDADGRRIRRLDIGARPAGYYTEKNRAAYWDGKNAFGEPVASGVYYYVLMADDFAATRKMLILK